MKKLIIMGALIITLFFVGGCQQKNSESTDTSEKNIVEEKKETKAKKKVDEQKEESSDVPVEEVTLTIAARGGSHAEVIELLKKEFEKEHHCNIEVLGLEAADLRQKIALDSSNKEGSYDLVMVDDPVMPEFIEGNVLMNLTKSGYQEDEDFVEASAALGKGPYKTGDTYALPFTGNVQLLFYNKDLLESKGYSVPESWEEVLDIAKEIKANGKEGYVIRGQQGNPIVSDFMPILWAFGGQVLDEDLQVVIDLEATRKALDLYVKLLEQGANYSKDDIVRSVSEGSVAMGLGWPSWFISDQGAAAGYAKVPSKENMDAQSFNTGMIGNWMMGVTNNSKNKELAKELLVYLTSKEAQKKSVEHGGVPTRTSIFMDEEILSKYPYFSVIYEGTKNSAVRPRTPKWSSVEDVFGIELSNVISGNKDVETAILDAQEAVEHIMK